MDIDNLEAGRELDALIADKVMGWDLVSAQGGYIDRRYESKKDFKPFVSWIDHLAGFVAFRTRESIIGTWVKWSPSMEIAAAWEVLLKTIQMCNRGGSLCWTNHYPDIYGIDVRFDGIDSVNAETPAHAICLAALKAVQA